MLVPLSRTPIQEHQHGSQNKKIVDNVQFLLQLIWFCCKSLYKYFSSIFYGIKYVNVHKFVDFRDQQRDSHSYDDGTEWLKNSNL